MEALKQDRATKDCVGHTYVHIHIYIYIYIYMYYIYIYNIHIHNHIIYIMCVYNKYITI